MGSGSTDDLLAAIRRLPLDERRRLIERATRDVEEDKPKPVSAGASHVASAAVASSVKLTIEEFLAARLTPLPGIGPVSLGDIEEAVAEGARGPRG